MQINVRATPRARQNRVIIDGDVVRVYTTAVAVDGAANDAVVKLLAEYYHVPKSQIKIVRGTTSRTKIIEIPE